MSRLLRAALMRGASLLSLAALLWAAPALAAIDEADLLPVDEAFVLSARATAPDRIALSWKIADGYYLYRHRTSVEAEAGFAAGPLQLPPGKAYEDEFFGAVETYRGALEAVLPGKAGANAVTLKVKYQGCADLGICYPPQTRELVVAMPTAAAARPLVDFGQGRSATGAVPLLGGNALGSGAAGAAPLPPEQAFGFEAIAGDGNTLLLRFTPARGYYLYRDKTSLKLQGPLAVEAGIRAGTPQWPRGVAHEDEYFGETTVYFDQVDVPLPLLRNAPDAGPVQVLASFQGCQTDGICYPPMTRTVTVELPEGAAVAAATPTPLNGAVAPLPDALPTPAGAPHGRDALRPDATPPANPTNAATAATAATASRPWGAPATGALAEDSRIAAALSGPNRWLALLSFFGFGLLLAFTPCVLPMIPILSGLIAGHGPGLSTGRAFSLSLVYVLANALVFTAAGVVAGLVGANLQIAFQTPWVIVAFALLFVALAMSSFGLYQVQLPAALRSRLGMLSDRQRGGSWGGVAAMGALSALIVGPCVAPPLAAAVLYIGQTRDPVFGGAALFLLAMGMGVPLLAFGVAAGRGLPTSGPWMTGVQRVFGLVFLGLAVWMVSRILPGPLVLALWGALLLGAAAMAGMAASRSARSDGLRAVAWTGALLLGVGGAAQLLGALSGGSDPLQPLAGMRGGQASPRELPFRRIKSLADLDREVAAAQAAGRPLMLDFYADWCVSCKEMERDTFPDAAVHQALEGFVLLKADVTANDPLDQALMTRLGIIGPPATLYYADGAERRELRLFGFEPAPAFAERARRARGADAPAAGGP